MLSLKTGGLSKYETNQKGHQEVNGNFEELHAFMANNGLCVHVTTISQALHKSGLHAKVAIKKALLKKAHLDSHLRSTKITSRDSEAM